MSKSVRDKMLELSNVVYIEDIPSPDTPEYEEHHISIVEIQEFIKEVLLGDITKDRVLELRDMVWLRDIPSPTVQEYVEHHNSIKKILKFIDEQILTMLG